MAISRTGAKKKRPRYGEMVMPKNASSDGATKTLPLVRNRACSLAIGVVKGFPKQIHWYAATARSGSAAAMAKRAKGRTLCAPTEPVGRGAQRAPGAKRIVAG